ncbi:MULTISPECIES: acetate/propionate family kinase [unclassified Lentimonas]|uniref:acetate/propionate family kinase n=1 Tax=unclassified Lentimonas TaxID=2630993 RepID=UPI001324DB95|nr:MULTISPECIES: acetate kinase [unclassified Lentimonas]CAA6677816.1 Acetate kinase (EC [Lentimonas sp. CC4]CAA6683918.1 Acetate kinase (EC [Lentimonas sp. CC6]CAA7076704.1 Acetate kinase (EC [Lentimonas sp. CC4]CAA7169962.1 Acetate kinase (EC [Lentimonas sp. CC21]CAA7181251.1 Acetate kinase (EC [Lentimonas sp. CC8]
MTNTTEEKCADGDSVGPIRKAVLVINCGSSSVKFALIDIASEQPLITGLVECVASPEASLSWKQDGAKGEKALPDANLVECLSEVIAVLPSAAEVIAVGHRVVHGAEEFSGSVMLCDKVMGALERCSALAPLHNPANIAGIRASQKVFPGLPQVGVFDTAFHQTLPQHAYLYPVPYDWYTDLGVRRYGFHGTSHRYVAEETARRLGKDMSDLSIVIAHLGNGCSACAIEAGQSVDTTMGLSPLEGLVMGTRSGDIDPALHEFISKAKGWSLERIMTALNKESGLLGISGQSNDMRTLVDAMDEGNERAALAIEVFAYRLAKSILGLTAALTKLDAIVFTGGIGENSNKVRAKALSHMRVLGAQIDPELNAQNGDAATGCITKAGTLPSLVVATNEELMIARETLNVTQS